MNFDRGLLEKLARPPSRPWSGNLYRHMFATFLPDRENTVGARWNPREIPAIYTGLSRDAVIAEAEYQISLEPLRPGARRTIYTMNAVLSSVLDLSSKAALAELGLSLSDLAAMDYKRCQIVGGAIEHLGHDGLLVPNVRLPGSQNLVIYPNRQTENYQFQIAASEVIFDPSAQ